MSHKASRCREADVEAHSADPYSKVGGNACPHEFVSLPPNLPCPWGLAQALGQGSEGASEWPRKVPLPAAHTNYITLSLSH